MLVRSKKYSILSFAVKKQFFAEHKALIARQKSHIRFVTQQKEQSTLDKNKNLISDYLKKLNPIFDHVGFCTKEQLRDATTIGKSLISDSSYFSELLFKVVKGDDKLKQQYRELLNKTVNFTESCVAELDQRRQYKEAREKTRVRLITQESEEKLLNRHSRSSKKFSDRVINIKKEVYACDQSRMEQSKKLINDISTAKKDLEQYAFIYASNRAQLLEYRSQILEVALFQTECKYEIGKQARERMYGIFVTEEAETRTIAKAVDLIDSLTKRLRSVQPKLNFCTVERRDVALVVQRKLKLAEKDFSQLKFKIESSEPILQKMKDQIRETNEFADNCQREINRQAFEKAHRILIQAEAEDQLMAKQNSRLEKLQAQFKALPELNSSCTVETQKQAELLAAGFQSEFVELNKYKLANRNVEIYRRSLKKAVASADNYSKKCAVAVYAENERKRKAAEEALVKAADQKFAKFYETYRSMFALSMTCDAKTPALAEKFAKEN